MGILPMRDFPNMGKMPMPRLPEKLTVLNRIWLGLHAPGLVLLIALLFAANPVHAAPPPKEIPSFALSAVRLGDFEIPPLFYLDVKLGADGKEVRTYVPLPVSSGSRGVPSKVSLVPPLRIYTGTFDAKGKPDVKPYLDIPAGSPGDRLLLVFYLDSQGRPQSRFLDDSEAVHPPGSVRVVNFGSDRIAFTVGGGNMMVAPGGEAKAAPVNKSDGRFPFVYFTDTPGETPKPSPTKLLRFRWPGQRMLVLYTSMPVEVATGQQNPDGTNATTKGYEPIAYRLFDSIGSDGHAGKPADGATATPAANTGAAATPAAARPLSAQEQEMDVIAPGGQIPDGKEIEIAWDGGKVPVRATMRAGEFAHVRIPITPSATLRFAKGGVIGTAALSASSRQHLVILLPGTDAPEPMSVLTFENSLLSHPLGGTRIVNLTPYSLAYSVGKEVGYVSPRNASLLAFPSGESTVKLAVKAAAGWKILSDARPARADPDKRHVIFVYKLPGKDEFGILEKTL
jgi:hypothetical protein